MTYQLGDILDLLHWSKFSTPDLSAWLRTDSASPLPLRGNTVPSRSGTTNCEFGSVMVDHMVYNMIHNG